jgi:hypothetical protein
MRTTLGLPKACIVLAPDKSWQASPLNKNIFVVAAFNRRVKIADNVQGLAKAVKLGDG